MRASWFQNTYYLSRLRSLIDSVLTAEQKIFLHGITNVYFLQFILIKDNLVCIACRAFWGSNLRRALNSLILLYLLFSSSVRITVAANNPKS